ncbi:MAG: HEAT repeat domain-containing protein [candidate division Zixibacteria bacterium]|nr:HEAT repeat domain-containing protein [candidate division Zixibacteria bacterium]MDH3938350.1 HEAT repeat domain-containing protein [candidate division Zixibacteria bacterium]MDH4032719.1 HEAT repeat domain-containing protein [candidate division Zixibacteria bacterium]
MNTAVDQIAELLARLQSPDFYEREEAVRNLGSYGEDEAVAGLVMALEDPDMGIRELAANLLSQMKGNTASQLLISFLGHADIGTRNLAAEILVKIGEEAVGPLLDDIDNDDYDIRKFIVDVLGLIKDRRSVEQICRKLYDENSNVACSAAEALGEIGSKEAVPALIGSFENVEDARLQAAEALGKIGDPSSLDKLYGFAKTDDPMIQYVVLEAIGNIGRTESISHLMPHLDDEDSTIAETALMAIINISLKNDGKIECDLPLDKFTHFLFDGLKNHNRKITEFTLSTLKHWYGEEVLSPLLDTLDSVEEEDRCRISDILVEVGPSSVSSMLDLFADSSLVAKLTMLDVIKQFIDPNTAQRLITFAEDPEPDVRQKIAHLLGISGFTGAIEPLKVLAGDKIGHVRSTAYAALGWLATENEIDFLFEGLQDSYADVRQAVLGALIVIGAPRVVERFTSDLYHDDVERQRLAVTALGMIGDADVVGPLLGAVNHPDASVRKLAIASLGRIQSVTDVQPLVLALSDESAAVRKAAVSALLEVKGQEAVHDIRALLEDVDVWVRYHTINAIGELGVASYADHILPYLEDDQDIIRIAAVKALALMGSLEAVPKLRELGSDKNEDIVRAVQSAVSELEGSV